MEWQEYDNAALLAMLTICASNKKLSQHINGIEAEIQKRLGADEVNYGYFHTYGAIPKRTKTIDNFIKEKIKTGQD